MAAAAIVPKALESVMTGPCSRIVVSDPTRVGGFRAPPTSEGVLVTYEGAPEIEARLAPVLQDAFARMGETFERCRALAEPGQVMCVEVLTTRQGSEFSVLLTPIRGSLHIDKKVRSLADVIRGSGLQLKPQQGFAFRISSIVQVMTDARLKGEEIPEEGPSREQVLWVLRRWLGSRCDLKPGEKIDIDPPTAEVQWIPLPDGTQRFSFEEAVTIRVVNA